MERNMKDILLMIKEKGRGSFIGKMEEFMMEVGKMGNSMEEGSL
jgi:hypothetical protein